MFHLSGVFWRMMYFYYTTTTTTATLQVSCYVHDDECSGEEIKKIGIEFSLSTLCHRSQDFHQYKSYFSKAIFKFKLLHIYFIPPFFFSPF